MVCFLEYEGADHGKARGNPLPLIRNSMIGRNEK
jgi:hypothetical protein